MLQGMKDSSAGLMAEIQLAWGVWCDVVGYDAVDFRTKGLDSK